LALVTENEAANNSSGIWYGVLAYTAWGILPLYWKLLDVIPAIEILAHRILWSFVFVFLIVLFSGKWPTLVATLSDRRNLLYTFLCGLLISLNWFTYIWAVNSNHVIEASMGYYINPLVMVLLSMTVLRERLNQWQLTAIALAATGVLILTANYGRVPWIALFLTFSFAFYGLAKKLLKVDAVTGLSLETFIVMPVALAYIFFRQVNGTGALGAVPAKTALILMGTGIVTALPLLWFAAGTRRIKFYMMGFLQYIAPSISLFLGVFIFKEYFSLSHMISFGFIWAGLLVFTLSNLGLPKALKPERQFLKG
jgi:chloramphenicol-sensitive protein RarD